MRNAGTDTGVPAFGRGGIVKRMLERLASVTRITFIPLVILCYVAVVFYNLNERDRRSLHLHQDNAATDKVHVNITVVSVDVARSQITARMEFRLSGKIARDELIPAVNLKLGVNAVQGPQRYEFARGERISPIEVVFPLAGESNKYPFDGYESNFAFLVTQPGPSLKPPSRPRAAPAPAAEAATGRRALLPWNARPPEPAPQPVQHTATAVVGASELAGNTPVVASYNLSASIPGFKFDDAVERKVDSPVTRIPLNLARADSVIMVSMGIQVMMMALALSLLAMVLFGTIEGKESAMAPLTFSTTLIFGLPALRDTQPGVPPLGAFSDYLSYLWAESIVAISTIIAIWTWIVRHRQVKALSVQGDQEKDSQSAARP